MGQALVNVFCKRFARGREHSRDLMIECVGNFQIFFSSNIKTCFPKAAALMHPSH